MFYRELNIKEQNEISEYLLGDKLLKLFWDMSKEDRQHSYEVFKRSQNKSDNKKLLVLSLIHDIGKSTIHAGLLFRIFSELGFIKNLKSQIYINHEEIGLELLKNNKINNEIVEHYINNLLQQKHIILKYTDY